MIKIPARGRHITQESQTIAPNLLGVPLATFRRRMAAFIFDTMVFGIFLGAVFLGLTCLSFDREDPTFFPRLKSLGKVADETEAARIRNQLTVDFLKIVDTRCPEALSADVKTMLASGDQVGLADLLPDEDLTIGFGSGSTRVVETDDRMTLSVGTDLLLGSASSVFSWGAFFVIWFTLWTRLGKGRSLGKRLLGIQIIRLDDKPLNWWDAFSRSGGYGASAATLFLGFLEAIFHPNRQAIHDRIAATVVVRK
jgi:RDD family